jgi:hypothetical protein
MTSVPAIWALGGLGISMIIIVVSVCLVFMFLFVALWGVAKLWRVIFTFFRYKGRGY